jgi:hypothetical protein
MKALSRLLEGSPDVPPGRFKYVVDDPWGKRSGKGKCHVLFAEGEIALFDPSCGFSVVEPLSAVFGTAHMKNRLGKSFVQFWLAGSLVRLTDAMNPPTLGHRTNLALSKIALGAIPLSHVTFFDRELREGSRTTSR